ncbi:hypothetical protein [Mycobacterium sp. IS-3022]|uniref:hypothetical protein n=1 Tax=Mycobacterium sp. IS-3022 TaxID=1772277 RepID=UPI00074155A9|nr:hypothetical protein [Mycobacterium sp. IS-3022]KUI05621.1 hypothetical protein AU188_00340 [Mycobacterium sp. IS-3022]
MTTSIASVGGTETEIVLISAETDEDDIASGDFVENSLIHGGRPKYTLRGTDSASMSMSLRGGETDVETVFAEIQTAVEKAQDIRRERREAAKA